MADLTKADSTFLFAYKQELDEIFRTYIEDINPFIIQFEVVKNEFPIELQNEIRAIYGHLARASIAETPEQAARNVQKIKSHTKRALLDCYKYSCVLFTDSYFEFFERYKGVDLSYLDSGRFLTEAQASCQKAKDAYFEAKKAELSNIPEEELFELYQRAYNKFAALEQRLRAAEDDAAFLKHKAARKEWLARISFAVGVIGVIVGVIGILI